jgi:hypothetical protein
MLGPADQLLALTNLARTRVLPGPEENVGAPLAPRLEVIAELVRAGELAVAFEILSDNLLEYDIPLSGVERNQAHELGTTLRADSKRIAQLQDLGSA